ncbi:MAG: DUF3817 domain-containing protein [Bacteroidota bacterium]
MKKIKSSLFLTGHLEGISFLLLLLVAMPVKYIFDEPVWVRIIGGIHGFLFVLFMVMLIIAWRKIPLNFAQVFKSVLLSFLPFGTFFLHKIIVEEASGGTVA